MDNNFLTGCPEDCETDFLYPAFDETQDCTNYDIALSQISDILIQPDGAPIPLTAWTPGPPTLVTAAIDNTVADNTKCRHLVGIGGTGDPTEEVEQYPKGKTKVTKETSTFSFDVLNLSNQYESLRQLGCGATNFRFWFADRGGFIYGGATGIKPQSIKVKSPSSAGQTDKKKVTIEITFEHRGLPERRVSPLA